MTSFERLSKENQDRARRIALEYPVTSEYVARLLMEFSPEDVVAILNVCSSVGSFAPVETLIELHSKGLGRR